MKRMYLRELRSSYKGLFGWIAGVLVLQLSGYSKFEGFQAASSSDVSGSINSISASFPKPLLALFGMYDLNISTLIGYFGILYLYFALIGAIHAALTGAGIISKEERDKTSEFLLTKPISRSKVMTTKLLAGLTNVLILFLVIAISSVIGVAIVNNGDYSLTPQVINMMWGILLMQLVFFSAGLMFAGLFKNPKLPGLAATTVAVGCYIVYALSLITDKLEWLRFMTPFRWFAAPSIIYAESIGYGYAGLAILISVTFVALAYICYNRRDITVA